MKSLENEELSGAASSSNSRRFFAKRAGFSALGAVVVFLLPRVFSLTATREIVVELLIASAVYLGCGSSLHRRASAAILSKRVTVDAVISLISSVLYWYSALLTAAWIFVPRFFPLQWLRADLTVRSYFAEACVVVGLGLFALSRRVRA